jgi:hypothetical protein
MNEQQLKTDINVELADINAIGRKNCLSIA